MPVLHAIPAEQKAELIRKFLELRIKKGFFSRLMFHPATMSFAEVMSMPEGTIVTIAETYFMMRSMDVPESEVLEAIEGHRSTMMHGKMPRPLNLATYAQYRVHLEHGVQRHLGREQIEMIITITGNFMREFCAESRGAAPFSSTPNQNVSPYFMSQLPHPDHSRPIAMRTLQSGEVLTYFEHPRTIGEVVAGIKPPYPCPQVVVIFKGDEPHAIFRVEQNAVEGHFLTEFKADGSHTNLGRWDVMPSKALLDQIEDSLANETRANADDQAQTQTRPPHSADEMPLSPSMPDVTASTPIGAWIAGEFSLLLVPKPKTIAEAMGHGGPSPVSYELTLAVVRATSQNPVMFISIERSMFGTQCLGVFTQHGHGNLGPVDSLDPKEFMSRAISVFREQFSFTGKIVRVDKKCAGPAEGGPKRPSDYELTSRIASTIDGFIDIDGTGEFQSDRLQVIVIDEFRVTIASDPRVATIVFVSVPLNELKLDLQAVSLGGLMRHMAVDRAALIVMDRLRLAEAKPT